MNKEKLQFVSLPACTSNREEKEAEIVFLLCINGVKGDSGDRVIHYCAKEHREIDYMKCPYCKKYKELNYHEN